MCSFCQFQAAFDMAFPLPERLLQATSVKINPFSSGLDAVVQVAECLDVSVLSWSNRINIPHCSSGVLIEALNCCLTLPFPLLPPPLGHQLERHLNNPPGAHLYV